jgi:hypothetical protein
MPVTTPEYVDLINELTKRKQQDVATAQAQGQGEAQRRGLVGQTGTSDIEMSLRGAKTAPIEQAYTGQIADTMAKLADQEAARKYQTSERLGSQQFQTGENTAQRGWQTGERVAGQTYGTGERVAGQAYGTQERVGTQGWQSNEQKLAAERAQAAQNQQNQFAMGERQGTQDWQSREGATERNWQDYLTNLQNNALSEAQKKAAREWWKNPVGQIATNVATDKVTDWLS